MDYQEAVAYITALQDSRGSEYSLEPVRQLCAMAGRPDRALSVIHIAGTNGKGSIGTYLSHILAEAGYTVGRYVSPVLFDYRERIQRVYYEPTDEKADCGMADDERTDRKALANRREQKSSPGGAVQTAFVAEQEVAESLTYLRKQTEQMQRQGMQTPTAFEIETVMAFLVMRHWNVDVALIECGMGGRTDATNLLDSSELCIFSHIGLDHTAFLGDDIAQIAAEKYAILKPGAAVVSVKQDRSAESLLQEQCEALSLPLVIADPGEVTELQYGREGTSFRYHGSTFVVGQAGTYQVENALAAVEAAFVLRRRGYANITERAVRDALQWSRWPGRFTCISEMPYVLLDGAHNPQAAAELRHSLEIYFPAERFTYICGVFRDKDYAQILDHMLPLAKRVYTITPPGARGLPAKKLAEEIGKWVSRQNDLSEDVQYGEGTAGTTKKAEQEITVCACTSVAEALQYAVCQTERTIVFGSLSFLQEVYACFPSPCSGWEGNYQDRTHRID